MIERRLTEDLISWSRTLPRAPLVITGAPRCGKTTVVKEFGKRFNQTLYFDLRVPGDRKPFEMKSSPGEVLDSLHFLRDKHPGIKKTLIILDDLSFCDQAANWLAASSQIAPDLFVLATSSEDIPPAAMPGTTRFKALRLRPMSFPEFLSGLGDTEVMAAYAEVPVPALDFRKLMRYYNMYTLIGGMPEVVDRYAAGRSLAGLKPVYEQIMERFLAEITLQIPGRRRRETVAATLQNAFPYAATRIRFHHFGNSPHASREMSEAFRWLEKHLLLQLVYPTTLTSPPTLPNQDKSPRLHMLDTGLVNYFSGIQKQLFLSDDMNAVFGGQIARQVTGQELLAAGGTPEERLCFWVRDKAQSTAEVDYIINYDGRAIPVEVKSGEPGRLRSLHQFMDAAPHPYAVQLYAGPVQVRHTETIRGKKFFLLSLPYFLAEQVTRHLGGFIRLTGA